MSDPYGERQQRRAQRQYERDMRRYNRYQNPMRGLAGGLFLIALIIGFALNNVWSGRGFLVLLFVGLAFMSLFGSWSTMHRTGIYGGMYGFVWMLGLALCFAIGFWPWILLPVAVTMILGALFRPIMGGLNGAGFTAQQQSYPPQEQPGYPHYQQGYQATSTQPHEAYPEGGQQYEQPPAHYPEQQQELPPQELPPM